MKHLLQRIALRLARNLTATEEKPKVLILTAPNIIGENDISLLREVAEVSYQETSKLSEEDLMEMIGGFDYLMLNYDIAPELSEAFYNNEAVRSLKAIAVDLTGMDWASPKAAEAVGITLLNIPNYSSESVAETTLAEILLHSRKRHAAYVEEMNGQEISESKGINLRGRTAGIAGLGNVGSHVASLLSGIGMKVVAWNFTEVTDSKYEMVEMEELFEKSDVIVIAMKSVKEGESSNIGIINAELLSKCKGTIIIINLANIDLVEHEAMLDAIENGQVIGYSVERKPELIETDAGSKLLMNELVHMPASNSWLSDESLDELRKTWVDNVIKHISGQAQNEYKE